MQPHRSPVSTGILFTLLGLLVALTPSASLGQSSTVSEEIVWEPAQILPASTVLLVDLPDAAASIEQLLALRQNFYRSEDRPQERKLALWEPGIYFSDRWRHLDQESGFETDAPIWLRAFQAEGQQALREWLAPKLWPKLFPGRVFVAVVPDNGRPVPVFGFQQDDLHFDWWHHLGDPTGEDSQPARAIDDDDCPLWLHPDKDLYYFACQSWIIGSYDQTICKDIRTQMNRLIDQESLPKSTNDRLINGRLFQRIKKGCQVESDYSMFVFADHRRLERILRRAYNKPIPNRENNLEKYRSQAPQEALGIGIRLDLEADQVTFQQFVPIQQPTPEKIRRLRKLESLSPMPLRGLPATTREATLLLTTESPTPLHSTLMELGRWWSFCIPRDPITRLAHYLSVQDAIPPGHTIVWADWTTTHPHSIGGIHVRLPGSMDDRPYRSPEWLAKYGDRESVQYQSSQVLRGHYPYLSGTLPLNIFWKDRTYAIVTGQQSTDSRKAIPAQSDPNPIASPALDAWDQQETFLDWKKHIAPLRSDLGDLLAVNIKYCHLPVFRLSEYFPSRNGLGLDSQISRLMIYGIDNDANPTRSIPHFWNLADDKLMELIWLRVRLEFFEGTWRVPQFLHYDLRTLSGIHLTAEGSILIRGTIQRSSRNEKTQTKDREP